MVPRVTYIQRWLIIDIRCDVQWSPNITCDAAQGKDAPRGNFLILYAEY